MEVTRGEMTPTEMPGRMTPSAKMPGEMSAEVAADVAVVAVMAAVEAPEMSKAAKAVKAAKTMETVKAAAKAVKAAAAAAAVESSASAAAVKAAAAVESSAAAPKGRGFAHNPRRDSRRQGGFEHESESDRRRDDFRPFASHDALLPPSLNHDLPETAPNPLHSQFFRRLVYYLAGRPMSSIRLTKIQETV
jgi:hypothetical protein